MARTTRIKKTDTLTGVSVNQIIGTFLLASVSIVGFSSFFAMAVIGLTSPTSATVATTTTTIQPLVYHSADVNKDYKIDLEELNYAASLQKAKTYYCNPNAYSGYAPGRGARNCPPHNSDYQGRPDWSISVSELLRLVQFYNLGGYWVNPYGEDGFLPLRQYHSADVNKDYKIDNTELEYVADIVQQGGAFHCDPSAYSGYAAGLDANLQNCITHSSDYQQGFDWTITTSELLRLIQFSNLAGYRPSPYGEDGFLPLLPYHSADVNKDYKIDEKEVRYVADIVQRGGAYHCDPSAYSGYALGEGSHGCDPHSSDYQNGADWVITTSELLRLVQFYNLSGYRVSAYGEDGFAPLSILN